MSELHFFLWFQEGLLLVGYDDGLLEVHDYKKKEKVFEHEAHDKRVKCGLFFKICEENLYVVTADSQGRIRLWKWKVSTDSHGFN